MAARAGPARIHHAADSRKITFLKLRDAGTGFHDTAHDFVAWHAWVNRVVPFIPGLMDIRVADATIQDVDLNVLRKRVAAIK